MTYPARPLYEILSTTAVEMPEAPATAFLGATLTFARDQDSAPIGWPRRSLRLGMVKGDRVGIMLPNCPQYIIATFATLRLGAVVVNINPIYTAREVLNVATDSGIRILITLDQLAPLALGVRASTASSTSSSRRWRSIPAAAAPPPSVVDTLALSRSDRRRRSGRICRCVRHRARRPRRAAVHRRHDGHAEGGDADARQHLRQRRADRDVAVPDHTIAVRAATCW